VDTESFDSTFGPKATRKRPKLNGAVSLFDLVESASTTQETFDEKKAELAVKADGKDIDWIQAAREAVFSKGQSRRIWNELYKVLYAQDDTYTRSLIHLTWLSMFSTPAIQWARDVVPLSSISKRRHHTNISSSSLTNVIWSPPG